MDILQLYKDYGVPHETEGHKHCRPGWVNTACPFCTGNPGLHLGATLDGRSFVCWRCGFKPVRKALAKLLGISEDQVRQVILKYGGVPAKAKEIKRRVRKKAHTLPSGCVPMAKRHRAYLEKRNFDPDRLERDWGLVGTGPISLLDGIDYKHRIIAPITWDGQQVSFQGRDITGKHKLKYLACPEERELVRHKDILYGRQQDWVSVGICVEGITDVWRLGGRSFATFGIKFTNRQRRLIAKTFDQVFIIFDDEPQAQAQAAILKADLEFLNVPATIVKVEGDPGGMDQGEADYLVKQLLP